jgi:steroid 5-alpha reductase family enzyme
MLCAAPVVVCNTRQEEAYDTTRVEQAALAGACAALCFESLADLQKAAWYARHPTRPTKADVDPPVCTAGLWAWSRHPNLFFELFFHWCVYAIVRPVEAPAVVICPAMLTVLVVFFPGGVCSQDAARKRLYGLYPAYVRYKEATPALIPLPLVRRCVAGCSPAAAEVACFECGV